MHILMDKDLQQLPFMYEYIIIMCKNAWKG